MCNWGGGSTSFMITLSYELFKSFFSQTERDISVRQRAIDLLYAMCDHSNAKTVVEELLQYLETADYSIRETLVSHILDQCHLHVSPVGKGKVNIKNRKIYTLQCCHLL